MNPFKETKTIYYKINKIIKSREGNTIMNTTTEISIELKKEFERLIFLFDYEENYLKEFLITHETKTIFYPKNDITIKEQKYSYRMPDSIFTVFIDSNSDGFIEYTFTPGNSNITLYAKSNASLGTLTEIKIIK
jgi:hypothetical protein